MRLFSCAPSADFRPRLCPAVCNFLPQSESKLNQRRPLLHHRIAAEVFSITRLAATLNPHPGGGVEGPRQLEVKCTVLGFTVPAHDVVKGLLLRPGNSRTSPAPGADLS